MSKPTHPQRAPSPQQLRAVRDRLRGEILSTMALLARSCPSTTGEWFLAEMQDAVDASDTLFWDTGPAVGSRLQQQRHGTRCAVCGADHIAESVVHDWGHVCLDCERKLPEGIDAAA